MGLKWWVVGRRWWWWWYWDSVAALSPEVARCYFPEKKHLAVYLYITEHKEVQYRRKPLHATSV